MDILSFETAKRLKDAGFPQPEFRTGQFWFHGGTGGLYFGQYVYDDLALKLIQVGGHDWFEWDREKVDNIVFAPTATDILRQLGGLFDLSFDCGEFWCRDEKDFNPAEAAAAAWLEENPLAPQ